ncbi:MAG: tetratricopeptide repeat protein [Candidatus Marinimicrobia bacterium]|nr:tetratricopeptide repeat protein [Candidatus Neomarinimicrobiota bacterium]
MYKQDTDRRITELDQALDSVKLVNRQLEKRIYLSPYASAGNPRLIYSKKEGERFFQKGTDAYNAQNYPVAVDYFRKCIDSEAGGSLIGDAYFWVGNSYIHLKDEYLALEYLKRVPEYPLCKNIDDALFLTAVTYRKLGDAEMARFFLERLLRRFPDGEMAKLALLELKRLKSMD